jgi:hypothetical protein
VATYYWVGGSGTWDNTATANWAASSGGAGGAAVPTNADNVVFDANSGTAATVDVTATAVCLACTVNKADITLSLSGAPTFSGAFTLTTGTVTLNSYNLTTLTFLASNANARTINAGTGSITVTGNNGIVFTTGNRTNLTLPNEVNVYSTYSGATGTRTINLDGGATGGTLVNLFVTAGTDTVSTTGNYNGSLDFTGFAGTWALGAFVSFYRGNVILNSTMTVNSGSNTTQTFSSTTGPRTINLAGKTIDCPVVFNGVGGSWNLTGTFVIGSSRALTLTNGTLNAGSQNVTIGTFALGSGTKTLTLGSGTWTVLGASWNANTNVTNLTVSASTATIDMTSGSSKTFSGGARTWPTLNQGGAGALTIAQNNTFTDITNTYAATGATTITFTAGTTQTLTQFTASGAAGNILTLNSSTPAGTYTLSDSGGTNSVSHCNISNSIATGGATWLAYTDNGNVNAGNNAGWVFSAIPLTYAQKTGVKLRSAAQRGRF